MKGWIAFALVGVGACTATSPRVHHGVHRRARVVDEPAEARIERSRMDPLAELARSERAEAAIGVAPGAAPPLVPYRAPDVDLAAPTTAPHLPSAPSFPPVLAEWPRTCERRGRLPDDELAYVEAWCADFVHADGEAAIKGLDAVATTAKTPGLGSAAREDLVGFVARSRHAPEVALDMLARAGMPRWHAAEVLSGAYAALGMYDASRAVSGGWATANGCASAVRGVLAHANETLDTRLGELARSSHCDAAVFAARCDLGLVDAVTCRQPLPPPPPGDVARVAGVVQRWHANAGADAWRQVAADVVSALPLRGAEAVAIAALANALVDDCDPTLVAAVASDASALRHRPDHDPKYDAHLAILVQATPSACAATHARHSMP